jgi:GNAT superfamily N-acetyltransferase
MTFDDSIAKFGKYCPSCSSTGITSGSGDSGLIALVQRVPVGAAWLRFFPASDPGYGFVDERTPELSVAVLATYRRKGIGSLLIDRLLQSVDPASLSCDPANPAWRLYIRLGLAPLEDGRTMLRVKSANHSIGSGPMS